jgi:threonyl-tRNA synthetase
MLHRAIAGSLERFMAVMIEHTSGEFPLWMAPVQVSIVPVSEKFNVYAEEVKKELFDRDIRVEINDKDESLGKRIREKEKQKVPYILVIGEKEMNNKTVTIRKRGVKEQETIDTKSFAENISEEINKRK